MKRNISIVLFLLLMTGCQGTAAVLPEVKESEIIMPDNIVSTDVKLKESVTSFNDLVEQVDTAVFLEIDNMCQWRLSDELLAEIEDPVRFVSDILQSSVLGHNFFHAYDIEQLSEGIIGFQFDKADGYAAEEAVKPDVRSALPYDLYQSVLKTQGNPYSYETLPLYLQEHRGYLLCKSSEQLFYAAEYGYMPVCAPGSDAERILRKCIGILSVLNTECRNEKQLYKRICQYVVYSSHYDDRTLIYQEARSRNNRTFFLEGSVEDGLAVCDGLCKEIVLLSRLCGLEAHHIGARSGDEGHAYVYVKCDGMWYLSCPTRSTPGMIGEEGNRTDWHTENYILTDFDTNMPADWPYDSAAHEEIEAELRNTGAYDIWADTELNINGGIFTLHPENIEEALAVLHAVDEAQKELQIPLEVELCGRIDVLKGAYDALKKEDIDVTYLSGGTFEGLRLQVYVFGGGS